MNRLKRFDGVEAVSISINSYPYNGSNSGTGIKYDTINAGSLRRLVTPDFFRVFRIEGINGESPQKLASLMKEGVLIVGGIWIPARQAMKIQPAVALREE